MTTDLPTLSRPEAADRAPAARRSPTPPDPTAAPGEVPSPGPHLRRRPLLDGLRGVMVVVTVLFHLRSGSWLHGGWLGVSGFFVLSGFLITSLLLVERSRNGWVSLPRFYARRARRLAPVLLTVTAGTVVAVQAAGATLDPGRLRGDAWATLFYIANWRFIETDQSYFSSFEPSPLRHTWSLAIEEQFYLVWPLLLMALVAVVGRRRLPLVLGAGALASAWWAGHLIAGGTAVTRVYDGTDTRAQELLVGAAAAAIALRMPPPSTDRGGAARRRHRATAVGLGGLAVFAGAALALRPASASTYTRGLLLLVAVAVGGLVVACATTDRGPLATLLGGRVLRALGARSYTLYLIHWPVIVVLDAPRLTMGWLALDGLRVVVALALTELVHRCIEVPFHQGRARLAHPARALAGATIVAAVVVGAVSFAPRDDDAPSAPIAAEPSVITLPPAPAPAPAPAASADDTGAATPEAPVLPRLVVLGDSQAFVLLRNIPDSGAARVGGAHHGACDIVGEVIVVGDRQEPQSPTCAGWPDQWARALSSGADAVVVSLGLRQVFDPVIDGERVEVGSERWEQVYRAAVDRAVAVIRGQTDAPVLWLDVPCYRWYLTNGEERDADRLRTINTVLMEQLGTHPGVAIAPYSARVCTGDDGNELIDDLRPDGVHLDDEAAADTWTWILGQVGLTPTH
ncbi:MAG TPA: acyltransferase family protein [Iamia sp.]|nr:acyltransferase family protein [Iamia sp.]